MKKILSTLVIISISVGINAQEAADKSFQAGLVIGSGINMQKMGTNYLANNGVGSDLTIGANYLHNFSETIGFCTGVEFDFETLKYKNGNYQGNSPYYYFTDKEIHELKEVDLANLGNKQVYLLAERKQKAVYLTVPTMMVFRTNFFGYFRYFGKFGLRNSFLLTSKINDVGYTFATNNLASDAPISTNNENMTAGGEMFFFKSAVGIAGGAEWNFSGSTSLVAELGYYYGFTPIHTNRNTEKGNNYYFATAPDNGIGNDIYFNNQAKQGQLALKISILF